MLILLITTCVGMTAIFQCSVNCCRYLLLLSITINGSDVYSVAPGEIP